MNKQYVSIGLINPKSPENVHSVMRAAGNFRVDSVFYTGERYSKAIKLNPNAPNLARKVAEAVQLTQVKCLLESVQLDMKIVCIEFAENALPLTEYIHPENALYIFGPEDNTIDQEIINRADAVVYVPTIGCMNLSATVNVVLYDRLAKSSVPLELKNNELIMQNRDINNKLVVNK